MGCLKLLPQGLGLQRWTVGTTSYEWLALCFQGENKTNITNYIVLATPAGGDGEKSKRGSIEKMILCPYQIYRVCYYMKL